MTDMRQQILDAMCDAFDEGTFSHGANVNAIVDEAADAIIAALPGMVKPLEMTDANLLKAAKNAHATIGGIYEWLERVEKAGGATSIEGVAACSAMLKSLRKNASRVDHLVTEPLLKAIADAEGGAS